jgi:ankyrin repeat protein
MTTQGTLLASKFTPSDHEALYIAVCNNDADAVRAMLAGGIPPHAEHEGMFPLFVAAFHNLPDMIDLLVDAGANPNQRMIGRNGGHTEHATALNGAAYYGVMESVEWLLDRGANPRSVDKRARTAAHLLVNEWRFTPQSENRVRDICRILGRMLDMGLPVNQRDEQWETVFSLAVGAKAPSAILEFLLDRGADPYIFNREGKTSFHFVCGDSEGRAEQFDVLARHGIDVNFATVDGRRPLQLCNTPDAVDAVLALGPDLEAQDRNGDTALVHMLEHWESAMPIKLLAAGASLDTPNFEGITPRDRITVDSYPEVAAFMAARQARDSVSGVLESIRRPLAGA